MTAIYSGINPISGGNSLSQQDKDKLSKLKTDGDGTKFLNDKMEYVEAGGGTDYDDTQIKTQISNINKAVGDINTLAVVGVKDLVSAVNKIDLSFMQSIVYNTKDGKKL